MQIIPALIPNNVNDIADKVMHVLGSATAIQIDVVDSSYTSEVSWPYNISSPADILADGYSLPDRGQILYEIDMMTDTGEMDLEAFYNMGASRFIFHISSSSTESLKEYIEAIDIELRDVIEIGIALHQDQGMDMLEKFINIIDFVQVMGIKDIGEQGHEFEDSTYEICMSIKAKYPLTVVSVDGGVKETHLQALENAGVDRVVMGTGFWESGDQLGLLNRYS